MELVKLAQLFRATFDPAERKKAEEELKQLSKRTGFATALLQIVLSNDVEVSVRQAAVIYLKNLILSYWVSRQESQNGVKPFIMDEQDKHLIRETILDATIQCSELLRVHLALCTFEILRHDFPEKCFAIVNKMRVYLRSPNIAYAPGVLLVLYQLVKTFDYKDDIEKEPLNEAMRILLPLIYELFLRLCPDSSEQSVLMQKQILKIFFALTKNTLPLEIISKEVFIQWMDIVYQVADRSVPPEVARLDLDDEDRAELPWYKCKKWAMHIFHRMFDRYGNPNKAGLIYQEFSTWYLKTFTPGILEVILRILDEYRRNIFVPPRVLQRAFNYIDQSVSHAYCWKLLKPIMFEIIQAVLFPIMSFSEQDEELWETDPCDYIRYKFDAIDDYSSHVRAAATLLHSVCKKRKDMLQKTIDFCLMVIGDPSVDHGQKDGALHMIGTVADIMMKKNAYKDQLDQMLMACIIPEITSSHSHLRARACWVLQFFSQITFHDENILKQALISTTNALTSDPELPVQAQAAAALQKLLQHHEMAKKCIEPFIKEITMKILDVIRQTESEDLTCVMQKIVETYRKNLMPIAVDMCQHLVISFSKILENDQGLTEEKNITAIGLLNTIDTILRVMSNQPHIMSKLEPLILQVITFIFNNRVAEFYEEAFIMVYNLTGPSISESMWKVLGLIHQVFKSNGIWYFLDMVPSLYNFITMDTKAFLSNDSHVLAVLDMCRASMSNGDEEFELQAAKLLEVMILQCYGRINGWVPSIMQIALVRLSQSIETSELKTMCLQVVIAALYYNPYLCFITMEKLQETLGFKSTEPLSSHFVRIWLDHIDCVFGLHDRKLHVIALSVLVRTGPSRVPVLNEVANQIMPSFIILFDGLKNVYASRASVGRGYVDGTDSTELDDGVLSSDEDEVDDKKRNPKTRLPLNNNHENFNNENNVTDDDKENIESDSEDDETALEIYTTPLDSPYLDQNEYLVFKELMQLIEKNDPSWYHALTSQLTPEQNRSLMEIVMYADQRKAALESKEIELSGGYSFSSHDVPKSFNFGGQPSGR